MIEKRLMPKKIPLKIKLMNNEGFLPEEKTNSTSGYILKSSE